MMKPFHSITITQEILNAIAELDEFKGAWRLLGKLTTDRLKRLRIVAQAQTVCNILQADGRDITESYTARVMRRLNEDRFDEEIDQLIAGYAFVGGEVEAHYKQIPFSQASIKQLHRWLHRYYRHGAGIPGQYKQRPNDITAGGGDGAISCMIAQTTMPYQTESAMSDLVYEVADIFAHATLHPLLVIAHFIGRFLQIHPFDTHNHMMAHVLLEYLLLQQGYAYAAYGSMRALHEDVERLYALLNRAYSKDATDFARTAWMSMLFRFLVEQKRVLESKIEREQNLNLHVSDYAATLLGLIQEHGKLSLSELVQLTGFNKHTTKKHVQELVKKQQIIMHGKARATWYTVL